jgi:hypothetical protein
MEKQQSPKHLNNFAILHLVNNAATEPIKRGTTFHRVEWAIVSTSAGCYPATNSAVERRRNTIAAFATQA